MPILKAIYRHVGLSVWWVKYINAQQWIHQSLKKIVYSVDLHIEVGLKTKPAGDSDIYLVLVACGNIVWWKGIDIKLYEMGPHL